MSSTRPQVNVASASIPQAKVSARIAVVEQHIRLENEHDLEGVLRTFGDAARYDDEPWGEHFEGRTGVRQFYEQLMKALPDLEIEVKRQHVTDGAILVEVMIRGTHLGGWRGLPATGEESSSRSAAYTHSTPMTVLPGKKSITTGGPC
jgi:steroid delta-isomerase-like uncharacterized protein